MISTIASTTANGQSSQGSASKIAALQKQIIALQKQLTQTLKDAAANGKEITEERVAMIQAQLGNLQAQIAQLSQAEMMKDVQESMLELKAVAAKREDELSTAAIEKNKTMDLHRGNNVDDYV
jgi:hypothetical protein